MGMNNSLELLTYIAGGAGFFTLALGGPLFALWLARARSRRLLLPLARSRGWQEVTHDGESLLPNLSSSWKRLLSMQASAYGTWQGLRAEFTATHVYKNRDATTVTVECAHPDVRLGPVSATDRNDPRYRDYHQFTGESETIPAQSSALLQRFRLWGEESDLRRIFVPDIERAILEFPGNLYSVSFYGRIASLVWIGYEKDPAIVDAALDLAASICRQVDVNIAPGGT